MISRWKDLIELAIEFTRECVRLDDEDYMEVSKAVLDGCRPLPEAFYLAEKVLEIVSKKREEVRARRRNNSQDEE